MSNGTYLLDPDARLDFDVDWATDWLADGETITSHDAIASTGITVDTTDETDGIVKVWVKDATPGTRTVTVRITTNEGRTDDRTLTFRVKQR